MLTVPIWVEAVPTIILVAAGILALWYGYRRGGKVWHSRHAIHVHGNEKKKSISGRYAELMVFAMVAIAVGMVMFICPDVSLYHAQGPEFAVVILWFACVYGAVFRYSRRKIDAGPTKDELKDVRQLRPPGEVVDDPRVWFQGELRKAYDIYNIYSCIVFGLGGLALAKVALQFRHDWEKNAAASRRLIEQAEALAAIRPPLFDLNTVVEVERAYLSFRELLSEVLVQVEPTAFLFLYVMAMVLVISMTPVSRAYLASARRLGSIISMVAVVVLLAISLGSYFLHATVASRELVDSLSEMKAWSATDYRHYIRYSEIYREVKAAGGFSGFIRALLSEAVFLAIVVGAAQQAAFAMRNLMERANR